MVSTVGGKPTRPTATMFTRGTFSRTPSLTKPGRMETVDPGRTAALAVSNLRQIVDQLKGVSNTLLGEIGRIVLESTIPYVPVDYEDPIRGGGALRDSGHVVLIEDKDRPRVEVRFGNTDDPGLIVEPTRNAPDGIVDYAVVVHETNTQYLILGARDAIPKIEAFLQQRYGELLR